MIINKKDKGEKKETNKMTNYGTIDERRMRTKKVMSNMQKWTSNVSMMIGQNNMENRQENKEDRHTTNNNAEQIKDRARV